jgi:hypothetical protein
MPVTLRRLAITVKLPHMHQALGWPDGVAALASVAWVR